MRNLVYGIGINDTEFSPVITLDSGLILHHPIFVIWKSMLERSYSVKFKIKNQSYRNTTCSNDWNTFSNFLNWCLINYKHGYELDKNLIKRNNTIYSDETCLFIPQEVNKFLSINKRKTSILPVGVGKLYNTFRARITTDGILRHLGTFATSEEAHKAWQLAKIEQASILMERYNLPQMQLVIDRLRNDYDNNIITEVI